MIVPIKIVKIITTKVGDPFSKESEQGPQVDGEQQEKVLYFGFQRRMCSCSQSSLREAVLQEKCSFF